MKLEVENLTTCYFTQRGPIKALDGVSFSFDNESIGIAGESGCGKSTLGMSLLRLIPKPGRIVAGSVKLDGTNILELDEDTFRRKVRWRQISMIFQGALNALNPVYTIGQQLEEPLIYHADLTRREISQMVTDAVKEVGLHEDIVKRYPHELSGGMKQRAVIAMALILRPRIVIADEPTTALDVIVQAQIINLLKRLKEEAGISIILVTHDLSVISELADKVGIMYAGEIVEWGPAEDIYLNPQHPYTQKLLAAIPRIKGEKRKLEFIPGAPPDLASPPSGCRFHPRCPYVMAKCRVEKPPLIETQRNHVTSCWLYGEH